MSKSPILALALATALLAGSGFLAGCEREGPGERFGEKVDDATDEMKDKLTPDGSGEKAGKKLDKAVDDLTD